MKRTLLSIAAALLFLNPSIHYAQQFTEQTSIILTGVSNSSVAWGDYDNDGDLDILLTGATPSSYVSKIYRNNGNNTFTEQTSMSLTGVWRSSAAWGDYDNDGDLDILLTGNTNSSNVSKIYRNNGNNTFTEQASISLTGVQMGSVAWGDYDNDGDLDILLSGYTNSSVVSKIYRNNGNNTFTEQTLILLTGVHESSIAWGDYDNDGDLDILLTGWTGSHYLSKIYRNNGNNTFTEQTSIILTGVGYSSVAWGDYDSDGDLDILLCGNTGSLRVTKIYQNNGNNTFTEQSSISLTGVENGCVEWGDYDNDGDLDILLTGNTNSGNVSKIYRNNGNNTFTEQTSISLTGVQYSSVAWGDYDNDGDLDIILTGRDIDNNTKTKIYRNNNLIANISPTAPTNLNSTVNGQIVTFSWNKSTDDQTPKNGLKYNLVIGSTPNGINKLSPMSNRTTGFRRIIGLGNTNHDTTWTIKYLPIGTYYWSVQSIDNQFAGSSFAAEQNFTVTSFNQFTEQISTTLTGVLQSSVAWGDYDNDNDLDILLTGSHELDQGISKIYKNNGDQTFSEQTSIGLAGVYNGSVTWGDYDNDGDLDILLCGSTGISAHVSKVYRNNGDNTFTDQSSILLTGVGYSSTAWGDYDNDGDLDILLTGDSGTGIISKIYRNNGNNTFAEQTSISLTGVAYGSVAWGDYDNDLDLDILLSGSTGSTRVSKIYSNNDDNSFTEQTSISLPGVSYSSVAWGDYDNDGDLDILLTGYTGSVRLSKIYRNNGDNTFTDQASISLINVYNGSVAWGDYDNDGDLDILLTGNAETGIVSKVYRNNGDNTFTDQNSISLTGVWVSSVGWADYDNDQDLDILFSGYTGTNSVAKLYVNNNLISNTPPTIPTNLIPTFDGQDVVLTWNKSTDNETSQNGLRYNLVIGTSPNSVNIVAPMSDRSNGFRRVVNLGNTNSNNSWRIKGLKHGYGTYYWSVQSVDNSNASSNFASEQNFVVPISNDTVFDWAKSGNGTGSEWGLSVSVDRWGNSYFLGSYNSPTINFSGTVLTNSSSSYDLFLIKYDLYGNLLWAKTFGSSQDDFGNEVVADSLGNVFIGGSFSSNSISFGSYTLNNTATNNTSDVFLAKLNINGDVVWAKSAGGNSRDVLIGMDADSLGNCYLTGSYASANITFGTTTLTNTNTDEDIFVAKYDYNGNSIWAKSGNGAGIDWGNAIAVDGLGNCYVTGSFAGTSITFSGNTLNNSNTDGSSDIFVVKYNSTGNIIWAKKWGGSGEDVGLEIDVSRDGKCYLTGPYQSGSLVFGSTTLTNSSTSYEDIFIVKLDQSGNALWAKSGNGNRSDNVYDIALDRNENIIITGSFNSHTVNFGYSVLTNVSLSDTADIFLVKYDSEGYLLWASSDGGNASDISSSVAVYNPESYIIGGTYKTNNLILGTNTLPNMGSYDVFIAYSGDIIETQILSITPPFHGVPATTGSVVFDISNIGNGNMNWSATSNDPAWLTITSGSNGINNGQIQVSYQANSGEYRFGTITIIAPDAIGSPYNIEVRQTAFGSDWIYKTSGTTETLNDIKFAGDQFGWVVGNNGLILHTTDSGNTWNKQTSPKIVNLLKVFFINSSTGWAVGDSGTILKTTNGGNLWELKNSNVTTTITALQFINENLGWAVAKATGGGIAHIPVLKSTDGGESWLMALSTFEGADPTSIHFSNANIGVIGLRQIISVGINTLFKTTDGGTTWTGYYHQPWYYNNYFNFASDLQTGLLVGRSEYYNYLYKTIDGGQNWNQIARHDNMRDFAPGNFHINSQGHAWILSSYSQTFALFTKDNCKTWGSQFIGRFYDDDPPPFNGLNAVTSFDSSLAWIVGMRGIILRYNRTQSSKSLTLTSPNGGKIYRKGETMNITWISQGIDQVKLILQDSYPNIAENIPAYHGSYLWQIPSNAMGSKIRVLSQDFDQIYDFSDNYFTILPSCFTWSLEDSTGKSASITIPTSLVSFIGEDSLRIGDYIGVFFHRNDSLICGGYGNLKEDELVITAWGDNIATPIKDGFYEGEEMVFNVFKPNSCEEYFAKVTLQSGSPTYQTNGNYVLTSLNGINGVRLTIEGFYKYNSTTEWLNMKDTVKAYLRNTSSPYEIVDSAKSILDTLGFVANFEFSNVTNGNYYLVIKHRNSIETWSSEPITITDGDFNCCNFTNDSSKAYGDNLKKTGNKWSIFSGDLSSSISGLQDGFVNIWDDFEVYNDAYTGTYRLLTDVNGDGYVDIWDDSIVYNNSYLGVTAKYPGFPPPDQIKNKIRQPME